MKKQQTEMDAKLKALNFRIKRSEEVLGNGDRAAVERHRESITTIVSTISVLKGSIEEAKFAQSESDETIGQWSTEIDNQIALADKCTQELGNFVQAIDQKAREVELKHTQEQTMQFEKQLLEQKLEAALKEKQIAEKTVRLPKLSITKFNGKPHDWVRFKGQFEAMVDLQNVPPITKFSHLKELVDPSIRTAIDCLPFTDEGYKRALKYLEDKYGHPTEVAGSYVVSLLELPSISERDVPKIHRFYEQLLFNIESLETLEKLDSIEGATYYVLRKLELIKAELVTHVKTDWRDWAFKDLLESLKKWTETNVVLIKINGQTFRALLDSGASHSYVSSTLIEQIKARPVKTTISDIEIWDTCIKKVFL